MMHLLSFRFWDSRMERVQYVLQKNQYFFVVLLFIGFITSASATYFIPIIRNLAVSMIFAYLIYNIFINYWQDRILFLFQMLLVTYMSLQHFLNQVRDFDADLATLLAMLLATLFFKNLENTMKVLKFIVIVNFIAMIYEMVTFEYIINIVAANKYEFGRMQGIFSYSKEAGYFLLISFVFLRYFNVSMFYKVLILFSSILSGSRTAMVVILLILIIDYIYQSHRKINLKKIFKQYLYLSIFILLTIFLASYYFADKTEYMLFRILSSFDLESSSQQDRLYFWSIYFNSLDSYSIVQWIFGNGTYLNNLVGNGSENTYLMIISQVGLIGLSLFMIPIIMVAFLFFKKPFKYYTFLLLLAILFTGRIGIGWADGILMWMLIYYILYQNYIYGKVRIA